jgi:DNA-binding XRE family transcriptional regulator
MSSLSPISGRSSASSFARWPNATHSHSSTAPGTEPSTKPGADEDKRFTARNLAEPAPANDVGSRFGRRLRELRRQNALTQSDMARKFGIDRSYISDVERGRKSISLPILEVIALGLRISLSDLFRDI